MGRLILIIILAYLFCCVMLDWSITQVFDSATESLAEFVEYVIETFKGVKGE
jgi:hypothetical protein